MSKKVNTVSKSLPPESVTDSCPEPQYSAVSIHSSVKGTPTHIRDWLTSSRPASPANRSVSPARVLRKMMNEISGPPQLIPSAELCPDSLSWKTRQASLLSDTFEPFTETWPKSGLMLNGAVYLRPNLERRIAVTAGGASLCEGRNHHVPTPTTIDDSERASTSEAALNFETNKSVSLYRWVAKWPTPTALDGKGSGTDNSTPRDRLDYAAERGITKTNQYPKPAAGMFATPTTKANQGAPSMASRGQACRNMPAGSLNPRWVEWLMGWPIGWTSLEPLETDKFRLWLSQHGCD